MFFFRTGRALFRPLSPGAAVVLRAGPAHDTSASFALGALATPAALRCPLCPSVLPSLQWLTHREDHHLDRLDPVFVVMISYAYKDRIVRVPHGKHLRKGRAVQIPPFAQIM